MQMYTLYIVCYDVHMPTNSVKRLNFDLVNDALFCQGLDPRPLTAQTSETTQTFFPNFSVASSFYLSCSL